MSLTEALRGALGERCLDPGALGPDALTDICRHALGAPRAWVRPREAAEVAKVVELARAHRTPIAVAGARTAYWRPLRFEGAVVLDVRGLDAIGPVEGGLLEVGAGARVRDVSDALSAAGASLVVHPDAYGDGCLGAMVATALASGVGMGRATVAELVTGLEVVLGTAETIRTGASRVLGAPGFARLGLPDPTSLFFGSEGALGIVTRVTLRAPAARPRRALEWSADGGGASMRAALGLARDLRARGAYDTFRVEAKAEGGEPSAAATLILDAPFGPEELDARCAAARAMIAERFRGAEVAEHPDPPRFWGAPEDHWASMRQGVFRGVDVVLGYDEAEAAVEAAGALYEAAKTAGTLRSMRSALYFAPGYVNLGLHGTWSDGGEVDAAAFVARGMERLSRLRVVPYRWGRDWGAALGERLDPGYLALLREVKRRCDPDGILSPGATPLDAP